MKPNTCLVIDVWEGQLEIDKTILKAAGVAGIGIRLNDMNGGHHLDTGFAKQWSESSGFVRFPYFVYNPWVNGAANFVWLKNHMPVGALSVAIDIEVRYSGITPAKYAGEIVKFLALCKSFWKTIIYTAEWFLADLKTWPKVDYWWAQYPTSYQYFGDCQTWDELKLRLDDLSTPFNVAQVPGTLKMWQFSGDYLTLPGSTRKIDVNIFYGSEAELAEYIGATVATDPTPLPGLYTFASVNYFARGGGPLTLPLTRSRGKYGDNLTRYPWADLKPALAKLNPGNLAAVDLIASPFWGPSKGLDGEYIKWIGLLWPGRNVVRVYEIVDGWGRVEGLYMADLARFNAIDAPDLVHTVYDYNRSAGYGERAKPVYVPILGGPWWAEMSKLVSIDGLLPKKVRAAGSPWLNVRLGPSILSAVTARKIWGTSVSVVEVITAPGGLWGRIAEGWIALRNNGTNWTDWKI